MRIIAGRLGGRQFNSPHGHRTHPMSDKARGALFTMLGDISGLTVLDAFAGSGALSFEAISRGTASAVTIDQDRQAQKSIVENMQLLGLENKIKLIKASANAWLRTGGPAQFDIVLCDPPYDNLQPSLLARLVACTKPQGLFVLSWPGGHDPPAFNGLELLQIRTYGDMQLLFYRAA
jgi:16S rRNA (guanine966-N2)-methyltransferase